MARCTTHGRVDCTTCQHPKKARTSGSSTTHDYDSSYGSSSSDSGSSSSDCGSSGSGGDC